MPKIYSQRQFRFFGAQAGRGVKWARNAVRGKKMRSYPKRARGRGKRRRR